MVRVRPRVNGSHPDGGWDVQPWRCVSPPGLRVAQGPPVPASAWPGARGLLGSPKIPRHLRVAAASSSTCDRHLFPAPPRGRCSLRRISGPSPVGQRPRRSRPTSVSLVPQILTASLLPEELWAQAARQPSCGPQDPAGCRVRGEGSRAPLAACARSSASQGCGGRHRSLVSPAVGYPRLAAEGASPAPQRISLHPTVTPDPRVASPVFSVCPWSRWEDGSASSCVRAMRSWRVRG